MSEDITFNTASPTTGTPIVTGTPSGPATTPQGDSLTIAAPEGTSYYFAAGSVLLPPPDRMTIGLYARILAIARSELERTLYETKIQDILLNQAFWAELARKAGALAELSSDMKDLLKDELQLFEKQQREVLKYNEGSRVEYNAHIEDPVKVKVGEAEQAQDDFIAENDLAQQELSEAQETLDEKQGILDEKQGILDAAQDHLEAVENDPDSFPPGELGLAQQAVADATEERDDALEERDDAQEDVNTAQTRVDNNREEYNEFVEQWNIDIVQINEDLQAKYEAYVLDVTALNAQISANNERIHELNAIRMELGMSVMLPLQNLIVVKPAPEPLPELEEVPPDITEETRTVFSNYDADKIPVAVSGISILTDVVIPDLRPEEQALFDQLKADTDALNSGVIKTYNDAINDSDAQVLAMWQAIADFKNGDITAAVYNAIRADYLAYASTKNSELDSIIDDYRAGLEGYNAGLTPTNDQIDDFNAARKVDGDPLLPKQSPAIIPSEESLLLPTDVPEATDGEPLAAEADGFPAIIPFAANVSPAGSATPTNFDAYIATFYQPQADSVFAGIPSDLTQMLLDQAYREYFNYYQPGYHILAPNGAYINRVPNVFFDTGTAAASTTSGVAMTSLTLGLDNKALDAIISNSIINAARTLLNYPIPATAAEQTLNFGLLALQNSAISSALPALGLLPGDIQSISAGGPGVAAAISLAFLHQIRSLAASGVLSDSIHSFLAESGLTETEIAQVEGVLTAGVTLGLLQLAVLQTAIALGLPGLIPQILGSLYGIQDLSSLVAQLSGFGLNDVLDNTILTGLLKNSLNDLGLTSADTINDTVNNVLAEGPFASDIDFKNALIREFKAAGLDDESAVALAEAAVSFARTERLVRDLDSAFVESDILAAQDRYNSAILDIITRTAEKRDYQTRREYHDELVKELIKEGYEKDEAIEYANEVLIASQTEALRAVFSSQRVDQERLSASLKQELIDQSIDEATADAAVAAALAGVSAGAYTSELLYREGLEEALRTAGITDIVAARVAAGAAIVQPGTDALTTISPTLLSREELAGQLTDTIAGKLKDDVGAEEALNIANQFVTAILGDGEFRDINSITNQLQAAVDYVNDKFEDKAGEILADAFTSFIKPSFDLFDLSYRFMDPANVLLLSAAWGPMYNGVDTKPFPYDQAGVQPV